MQQYALRKGMVSTLVALCFAVMLPAAVGSQTTSTAGTMGQTSTTTTRTDNRDRDDTGKWGLAGLLGLLGLLGLRRREDRVVREDVRTGAGAGAGRDRV